MKVKLQLIRNFYLAIVLLTNCYMCLRNNKIESRFAMRSSSLLKYLQVDRVFNDFESSTLLDWSRWPGNVTCKCQDLGQKNSKNRIAQSSLVDYYK